MYFAPDSFSDIGETPAKTAETPPQPQQTSAWLPFTPPPQDARYAQPQRTGQARHAKRPKHAKPSTWLTPSLRTGSGSGRRGL